MKKIGWLFFTSLLLMLGCATEPAFYIENSNLPVAESRIAITSVIGKPRLISLNGRELTSVYHDRKFEPLDLEKKFKVRFYTKVIILGPRRPYEISVEVIKEVFEPQTQSFVAIGMDEGLTQMKAQEIKKALNKGLDSYRKLDGDNPF